MTQHKLLPEGYLNNLTTTHGYLSTYVAAAQLAGHTRCVAVRKHLSRNKRTLSGSCIDALDHFDVATVPHCIAMLHARVRQRLRSAEESNREWTRDSTREISIAGYTTVVYNARWLVIPVRSLWGGDLRYRLEDGRFRYTSKPHSSRRPYRLRNELSTLRLGIGKKRGHFRAG